MIQARRAPKSASTDLYCGVIVSPGKSLAASCLGLEKAKWAMGQDLTLEMEASSGKVAQWIKALLCRHEDLNSTPSSHIKAGSVGTLLGNGGGWVPGTLPVSYRSSETACLKAVRCRAGEASGLPVHIQVHTLTFTQSEGLHSGPFQLLVCLLCGAMLHMC